MQYKILLVEDDTIIATKISEHLIRWGYDVCTINDFQNVSGEFAANNPHLVLLDICLPFFNGYHWCNEIRKISQVPIIFISSADDNMNIVMAVNMGGDDFIAKPFDLDILSAKIQALLRRTYAFHATTNLLEHNGCILNLSDMTLSFQGRQQTLSKNEFRILQLLFENPQNTVSREKIMKRLWDDECFVDDNTLTVNINRLRRALNQIGLTDFITTRKGIGYQLKT